MPNKYFNELGDSIDEKYIHEHNKHYCYACTTDREVRHRKRKIIKNRNKPNRYNLRHAKKLSDNLYDKTLLPWGLEAFIIVLNEIDSDDRTKWKERARKLLIKFHENDFNEITRKFTKKD